MEGLSTMDSGTVRESRIRRFSQRRYEGPMKKRDEDPGLHLMVGFQGFALGEELKAIIREFRVGGIVLFRRNVESPPQLRELLETIRAFSEETLGRSLLVAIDQEGGPVQRLVPPFTRLPSAGVLGTEGIAAIEKWQTIAARELREMGIHINFAPVLDLVPNGQGHFMEARSLGNDGKRVAELGAAWIATLQGNGVSATAKHFPGLGGARKDPHHHAPLIHWADRSAMERDILPFREAVRMGVHCIMTSHARYPLLDRECPATLSEAINRKLLRETMGFRGVLFSDDLDMAAVSGRYSWDETIRRGMASTIDFFLVCQRTENIAHAHRALHEALQPQGPLGDLRVASRQRIGALAHIHQRT